jgi:hypothetical protein
MLTTPAALSSGSFMPEEPKKTYPEFIAEQSFGDGPDTVTASLKILDSPEDALRSGAGPFVELILTLDVWETIGRPDQWRIVYDHYPSTIWNSIEGYLKQFCPEPEEVLKVVRLLELELPANVLAAIKGEE